ncbi:hypothetical protein Taro_051389 [Colocasia esculenta]|uniref:NUC153 domain-containing protein n=1 Tax=Colocasia esculenta TaxID=4460 RepID=A0A843XFU0_COLES|nr:hypothetical protein [Colocasia esculenta]
MTTLCGGLKVLSHNGVKVYCITGHRYGATPIPMNKLKSLKRDEDFRRRLDVIHDLKFETATSKIKVTPDGEYVVASGIYPPQVSVYELKNMALKFERHLISEIINFQEVVRVLGGWVFCGLSSPPYGARSSPRGIRGGFSSPPTCFECGRRGHVQRWYPFFHYRLAPVGVEEGRHGGRCNPGKVVEVGDLPENFVASRKEGGRKTVAISLIDGQAEEGGVKHRLRGITKVEWVVVRVAQNLFMAVSNSEGTSRAIEVGIMAVDGAILGIFRWPLKFWRLVQGSLVFTATVKGLKILASVQRQPLTATKAATIGQSMRALAIDVEQDGKQKASSEVIKRKLPKVNRLYAASILENQEAEEGEVDKDGTSDKKKSSQKRKTVRSELLRDERFSVMFENKDFEVDEKSEEFLSRHAHSSKEKWNTSLIEEHFEPVMEDDEEQSRSDSDASTASGSSEDMFNDGKSKVRRGNVRVPRLYEVKDERHAEAFWNSVSLAEEDALPLGERGALQQGRNSGDTDVKLGPGGSREITFHSRSSKKAKVEKEEKREGKRRCIQSLGLKSERTVPHSRGWRGGRRGRGQKRR